MGEFAREIDSVKLDHAGAVFLDDAAAWLDEFAPDWREKSPHHDLASALQALMNAWADRGGAPQIVASSLAHQVALLIDMQDDADKAMTAFNGLVSRCWSEIIEDRKGVRKWTR